MYLLFVILWAIAFFAVALSAFRAYQVRSLQSRIDRIAYQRRMNKIIHYGPLTKQLP